LRKIFELSIEWVFYLRTKGCAAEQGLVILAVMAPGSGQG